MLRHIGEEMFDPGPAFADGVQDIRKRWPWVKHLFADGAYDRLKLMDKAAYLEFVVEIIRRSDGHSEPQVTSMNR